MLRAEPIFKVLPCLFLLHCFKRIIEYTSIKFYLYFFNDSYLNYF